MREIEELMRRDQEENKNLPDRIVIDSQEFTNIRVREISLEPKIEENEEESQESELPVIESESTEVESSSASLLKLHELAVQTKEAETEFDSQPVDGDNSQEI